MSAWIINKMTKISRGTRKPSMRLFTIKRELAKLKRNQRILNTAPIKNKRIFKKTGGNRRYKRKRAAFLQAKNHIMNLCL